MTGLTVQALEQLAYNAGFRGSAVPLAAAVALAESGGNPKAYNPETAAGTPAGSGSRGLWQIYGAAHPMYNNDAFYDPQANANAAYAVYQAAGGQFTPWSTYNNGAALKIAATLPAATMLPIGPTAPTTTPNLPTVITGTSMGTSLPAASAPAFDLGTLAGNVGLSAIAGVLLLFGFILIVKARS